MLRLIFVLLIVAFGMKYAVKGAFGALLLYLWVAYFRPQSWAYEASFLQFLNLSFTTGVYLLFRSTVGGGTRFRVDLRVGLLLVFFCLSLASTAMSAERAYAWPYWVEFSKAAIVSYLLAVLVTDGTKFRTTVLVIALSLGFESAKQGWVELLLHPGATNTNGHEMLGDNNGLAVGMLALVPLFIALAQTAKQPWEKWMHRFFVLGVAYRGISTYSRGGFLAAGAMMIVYIVRSKQRARAAVGALLVAVVVLSVLPQRFWDRMSTLRVTSEDQIEDDSALSRLHFWRVAVNMANANPILGVGYNAYNSEYNKYDFLNGRYGFNRAAHSMWFGVLAELGYPGFLTYVAMLLLAVVGSGAVAAKAARGEIPKEFYCYGVALQTSFAAIFVGGSFVPWQYTELLWHLIALTMALRWVALDPALAVAAPAARVEPARPPRAKIFQPNPAIRGAHLS